MAIEVGARGVEFDEGRCRGCGYHRIRVQGLCMECMVSAYGAERTMRRKQRRAALTKETGLHAAYILEDWANKMSLRDIAAGYGVSHVQVKRIADKAVNRITFEWLRIKGNCWIEEVCPSCWERVRKYENKKDRHDWMAAVIIAGRRHGDASPPKLLEKWVKDWVGPEREGAGLCDVEPCAEHGKDVP